MYPPLGPCVSSSAGRAAARRLQGLAARRADPAGGICASGSCASGKRTGVYFALSAGRRVEFRRRAAARRLQGFAARRADPAGGICASGSRASGKRRVCLALSAGRVSIPPAAQRRGGFRGLPPEGRTPRAGSARADPALAESVWVCTRPFCRPLSSSAGRAAARRLQGSSARRADPAGGICASGSCASGQCRGEDSNL